MPALAIRVRITDADLALPLDAFKDKLGQRLRVAYGEAIRAHATAHGGTIGGHQQRVSPPSGSEPALIHASTGARLRRP